ncbi:hypothetical protein BT69DRAFT_1301716 [Atractiella rhizophila]|nr:hypothetical protein BT69DRAFT_1301716 [Atractiella rhizophila]
MDGLPCPIKAKTGVCPDGTSCPRAKSHEWDQSVLIQASICKFSTWPGAKCKPRCPYLHQGDYTVANGATGTPPPAAILSQQPSTSTVSTKLGDLENKARQPVPGSGKNANSLPTPRKTPDNSRNTDQLPQFPGSVHNTTQFSALPVSPLVNSSPVLNTNVGPISRQASRMLEQPARNSGSTQVPAGRQDVIRGQESGGDVREVSDQLQDAIEDKIQTMESKLRRQEHETLMYRRRAEDAETVTGINHLKWKNELLQERERVSRLNAKLAAARREQWDATRKAYDEKEAEITEHKKLLAASETREVALSRELSRIAQDDKLQTSTSVRAQEQLGIDRSTTREQIRTTFGSNSLKCRLSASNIFALTVVDSSVNCDISKSGGRQLLYGTRQTNARVGISQGENMLSVTDQQSQGYRFVGAQV